MKVPKKEGNMNPEIMNTTKYKAWVISQLILIAFMGIIFPIVMVATGAYWEAVFGVFVGAVFTGWLFGTVWEIRNK